MIRRLIVCGALAACLGVVGCDKNGGSADPKIESPNAPQLPKQTPSSGGAPAAPGGAKSSPGGRASD